MSFNKDVYLQFDGSVSWTNGTRDFKCPVKWRWVFMNEL